MSKDASPEDRQMSKDASPEDRQKILDCLKSGRVTFAGDISLLSQPRGPLTINHVKGWGPWIGEHDGRVVGNDGGFDVRWSKPGTGFGSATFVLRDGKWTCDDEFMGRDFINEIIKMLRFGDYGDEIAKQHIPQVLDVANTIELRSDIEEF